MVDVNTCYKLCDVWFIPAVTVFTFLWTIYQEIRHRNEQNKLNKKN